jgi:hypothetical protein
LFPGLQLELRTGACNCSHQSELDQRRAAARDLSEALSRVQADQAKTGDLESIADSMVFDHVSKAIV